MQTKLLIFLFVTLLTTTAYASHWRYAVIGDAGVVPLYKSTQRLNLASGLLNSYVRGDSTNFIWGAGASISYDFHV